MKTKIWLPIVLLLAGAAGGAYWYLKLRVVEPPASLAEAPAPKVEALSWEGLLERIGGMAPAEIRQHGVRLFREGDPDRAFLLFKTAAKRGDGWAALAIGEMYDPATFAAKSFDPKRTAFSKPNPGKALYWYEQAIEHGEKQAWQLYDRLVAQQQRAAERGDQAAQRVLKNLR
jgi:TPR repeat protein